MTTIVAYHGTNARFERFDQGKARIAQDYFGGGTAYATDNMDIAKQYSTAMYKKYGGERIIYKVRLNLKKVFDVDKIYTGKELLDLIGNMNVEQFARGAGLLNMGADKYKVLSELKDGTAEVPGDQVFRGLSGGMIKTANARDRLIKERYDGLRYNGGVNMNATRHNVYIIYNARNIQITDKYIYAPQGEHYSVIH